MCPFSVLSGSGKCLLTFFAVNVGHVTKFPASIAAIYVDFGGYPTAAWRKQIAAGIKDRLCTDNALLAMIFLLALF